MVMVYIPLISTTCPWRFIIFTLGWDRMSACKGDSGSPYQSMFWSHPSTQPTHQMKIHSQRLDHKTGIYVLNSSPTVCGFFDVPRSYYEQGLWDGTYGLSSLSEKTRKSNHLKWPLQRKHFLLSYFKILSGLATSRTIEGLNPRLPAR